MTDLVYRACAVCGRMLANDEHGQLSHAEWEAADHVPVPVDPNEIPQQIQPRCDFCCYGKGTFYSLPVAPIEHPVLLAGHSPDDFATCAVCASLIHADDWDGVFVRSVILQQRMMKVQFSDLELAVLKDFHDLVRRNITGPLNEGRPW